MDDKKLLEELEIAAEALLTPKDIAVLFEYPLEEIEDHIDSNSAIGKAIMRGYLKAKLKHHQNIIEAANHGSNPAQEAVGAMINAALINCVNE